MTVESSPSLDCHAGDWGDTHMLQPKTHRIAAAGATPVHASSMISSWLSSTVLANTWQGQQSDFERL